MATNSVTIAGATYPNVPAVDLSKVGGGTARYFDVSDTTAVASDVAYGKLFYTSGGVLTSGTKTDQGVTVVTTQDSHGGDIVEITATPIIPWSPWGEEAELFRTYDMGTTKLSATGFNTWTPTTQATSIQATSNLGTITSPALDQYEYAIKTVFESNTQYAAGTTLAAAVVRQIFVLVQNIYKKPSNFANLNVKTDNYNYCTTLFTAPLMKYYSTGSVLSMAWTGSYGIYPSLTAATFSSNTSDNATITIKAPTYNARCYKSYFKEAMASAVDKENSTIKCKVYVYRISKAGSTMYSAFREIVDIYNA